jgi:hypothetical protein
MGYMPGALAVVGSNPTGPTEPSVQVLQKNKRLNSSPDTIEKNLKVGPYLAISTTRNHEMRDLYYRQINLDTGFKESKLI